MAGIKRIFGFRMLKYLEFLNINGNVLYNLSGNGAEVSVIEEWRLHFNHYQHKQGEVCGTTSSFKSTKVKSHILIGDNKWSGGSD